MERLFFYDREDYELLEQLEKIFEEKEKEKENEKID